MKRWLITAAALLALFGLLGAGVAVAGLVPIAASSGHFAVTRWLLEFTKRRSVATHTLGVEPPPLGDPVAVLKGAGHFEVGCRPCHGAPDLPRQPRIGRAMLPPPPNLSQRVLEWEPEELFYIVRNGIKFTGMPAWPSLVRDDEVAAVVAFLTALPSLDAEAYRRLVHGPGAEPGAAPAGEPPATPAPSEGDLAGGAAAPEVVHATCGRCHGLDGRGRGNAAFPALAGQAREHLQGALEAFASDRRQSGIMQPIATRLSDAEMREAVEHYARLPARAARGASSDDAAAIDRGRSLSDMGLSERRVPSCSDCHGPSPADPSSAGPALAGQYADYLMLQLGLLAAGNRGGTDKAHIMSTIAARLTREQMRDVSLYYESLQP